MPQDKALPFEKDDSRLRILYLYRMLRDHTDESHTMSTGDIQQRMTAEHGITMHRTTLSRDIEVLRAAGVEVISERKRSLRYYLADRPLSLPELRLLIDAVLSSKFITEKKSRELVEKLIALNGEADADKLRRTVHVTGKAKSDNEKGYYIVDAIIDLDEGYVYRFLSNDDTCERGKISYEDSGDSLGQVIVVTYHDGSDVWQEGFHFKWSRQPDHLINEDYFGFETDFYSTDLEAALKIRATKHIKDY